MLKRALCLFGFMLALPLLLAQLALAQTPRPTETAVPLEHGQSWDSETAGVRLHRTADITFTPVATLYLPIVLQNYAPCTTVPTLLSPANGAALNTLIPLFQWDSGNDPHATEFSYEASKDISFDYTLGFISAYDTQGVHEDRLGWNFEPATIYYWRAYLMCGAVQGPYTDVWTFTTGSGGTLLPGPNLVSPADGVTLPGTTVTLHWSSLAGAVEYNVYRKRAGSYTSYWTVDNTESTLSGLNPNTTYEWWITARNDYAWGAESAHRFFTTGPSNSVTSSIETAARSCRSQRHAISTQDCLLEETRR
ncbi:MAG TPA: fibronectin type III domain-containing protein [Anaerolineae bacterium]|nr:fibronectin type III domain-containing protein [Anaerolineae bacterium]